MSAVFVIEDDPVTSRLLAAVLRKGGFRPVVFSAAKAALDALESEEPAVVCLDVLLPEASGEAVLLQLRSQRPDLPIIVLSGQESVARAVDIMKLRPFDYFVKPVDHDRLVRSVEAAIREHDLRREVQRLEQEVKDGLRFDEIVGRSARMRRVYEQVEKVLDNRVSVFIHGQSGTGKELVAKAIHYNGARRSGPFVTLNCGAIAESLQESELFGHEKGAFTGAVALSRGKFEQAHRGTLFLDEVGELSQAVQTRLLRVLQEGTLQRLGGAEMIAVDVRIISATHRDLEALVREGRFRQDLFYRLVVRTLVSTGGGRITVDGLPQQLVLRTMGVDDSAPPQESAAAASPDAILPLKDVERKAITHAIRTLGGSLSLVAKRLGVGRATLYRKLTEYQLADIDTHPPK